MYDINEKDENSCKLVEEKETVITFLKEFVS